MRYLILVLLVFTILLSCSEEKPKVDTTLEKPQLHLRLGYTSEQILFWENNQSDQFKTSLTTQTDTALVFSYKNIKTIYNFVDNLCSKVTMTLDAAKNAKGDEATFFDMMKAANFTIIIDQSTQEENKAFVTTAHNEIPNLRCTYSLVIGERSLHSISFYKMN